MVEAKAAVLGESPREPGLGQLRAKVLALVQQLREVES